MTSKNYAPSQDYIEKWTIRLEDYDFMLAQGEHPERAARRLGYGLSAIEQAQSRIKKHRLSHKNMAESGSK